MRYLFADCEFDAQLAVLRRGPHVVNLRPKVAQVLRYLLDQRAQVVTKHALLEAVWPDHYISDATLTDIIRVLRRAVGDTAHQSQIIQTRHGHGYRFVAAVQLLPCDRSETSAPPLSEPLALAGGEHKVVTVLCVALGAECRRHEAEWTRQPTIDDTPYTMGLGRDDGTNIWMAVK